MVLLLSACDTPWFKLEWAPVDLSNPRAHTPSQVLAADGSVIGVLQINRHEPVTREQIPDLMVAALTSAEDRRFFEHNGIDVRGIARAVVANQQEGRVVQGGSTITQQLIKNQYLDATDKTLSRKAREANMALKLEEIKSKDEILTDYCNTVYLGSGSYGMQAGASTYFNTKLSDLTLEQIALLVGILRRPEGANPYTNPDGAREERHRVLVAMKDVGHIDEPTFTQADTAPLTISPPPTSSPYRYPRIIESVRRQIVDSGILGWGEEDTMNRLFSNGYTITTTINPQMQDVADRVANKHLSGAQPETAIVLMDPTNAHVRALVGGRDPEHHQFNLATQGKRQPGSVFKVFALAAALENGLSLDRTFDAGPGEATLPGGEQWAFTSAQPPGEMTIADGLVVSSNGVYARLGLELGGSRVAEMASRLGVETPQSTNPANVLGGIDPGVTPFEMAGAFATLANHGIRHEPVLITSVSDAYGNELLPPPAPEQAALTPEIADEVTHVMQRVISEGTGKRAHINRPAAGKTGTVNNNTDAWFVGYTPNLVGAVWVGYPDAVRPMHLPGYGAIQGGNLPAVIWGQVMSGALSGTPVVPFSNNALPTPAPEIPTPIDAPSSPVEPIPATHEPQSLGPSEVLPAPAYPRPPSQSPYRPDPVLAPRLPQAPPPPRPMPAQPAPGQPPSVVEPSRNPAPTQSSTPGLVDPPGALQSEQQDVAGHSPELSPPAIPGN
ncbi:transglycosylase domain-containing protein [Stomatohabitans albus]|uniref:transglycosylase domain-containing protein n=1 Tax=Stomatohabitans albus TaxID=3110766 RepID=UPI00300C925E